MGMDPQMIENNSDKQFSTLKYKKNNISEGSFYFSGTIPKQFRHCLINFGRPQMEQPNYKFV